MTKARKPVIAVTAGFYTDTRPYTSAIADAGGVPIVLLPGQTDVHLDPEVDGVVLAGGIHAHPHLYGHDFDPTIEPRTDEPRDHLEISILRLALERGVPILGICRGLQLINVFFGGTLQQNLASKTSLNNIHQPNEARDYLAHSVIAISGKLRDILGSTIRVNSIHQQAIQSLGSNLRATVLAEDGVVEGVETPDGLVLAVQWHPEELAKSQPQSAALFTDLVRRGSSRRELSSKSGLCLRGCAGTRHRLS